MFDPACVGGARTVKVRKLWESGGYRGGVDVCGDFVDCREGERWAAAKIGGRGGAVEEARWGLVDSWWCGGGCLAGNGVEGGIYWWR